MNATKVVEFFNSRFWPMANMTQSVPAALEITFKDDHGSITIPIEVSARTTIREIFAVYADFLKEKDTAATQINDFGTVSHKGKTYRLERFADGTTMVLNEEGKSLSPNSPLFKQVVKQFDAQNADN